MSDPQPSRPLADLVADFLADLAAANRPRTTQRIYATDLRQLCAFHADTATALTPERLRAFFLSHNHLRPATRARKQAIVARFFLAWTHRHDYIAVNPMGKIERVHPDPPSRGVSHAPRSSASLPSYRNPIGGIGCSFG